jgi:hypothetical protein
MASRKISIEKLSNSADVRRFVSANQRLFPNSNTMNDRQLINDVLQKTFGKGIIAKTSIAKIFAMNQESVINLLNFFNIVPSGKDLRNKILLTEALAKKGYIVEEDINTETYFPQRQLFIGYLNDIGFYEEGMSSLDIVLKLAILCLTCGAFVPPGFNIPLPLTEAICPQCIENRQESQNLIDFQEDQIADDEYYNDYEYYNEQPEYYYEHLEQPEQFEQFGRPGGSGRRQY